MLETTPDLQLPGFLYIQQASFSSGFLLITVSGGFEKMVQAVLNRWLSAGYIELCVM